MSQGIFMVFGVPGYWSKPSLSDDDQPLQVKALQFTTIPYEGDVTLLHGFDPKVQIALSASEEDHRKSDGTQSHWPTSLDKFLPGISGCSIWKICHRFEPAPAPNATEARVVGVETGVFPRSRAIVGTRWGAVAQLMKQKYPELASAFKLVWP